MFTALFFMLTAGITILWSFPFLLMAPLGYGLQKLSGRKLVSFLAKHVAYSSIRTNDEPSCWVVGKWFIGYVYETSTQNGSAKELCVLMNAKKFKAITEGGDLKDDQSNNTIEYWERDGTFYSPFYESRNISPPSFRPWPHQEYIIKEISAEFFRSGCVTVLLTGEPGSGKSMIPLHLYAMLLSLHVKVILTDTFNPSEPGDNFGAIYNKANPTPYTPDDKTTVLVIVIEEVDGMVYAMHNGKIAISTTSPIPIQIKNKTDWNLFFDRFDRGLYQGAILILTSNHPLKWFDDLDPSYMRYGRLSKRFEVVKDKVKQT